MSDFLDNFLDNPRESYVTIENPKNWLLDKVEVFHPADPRYIPYWADLKKKCIEGVWGSEFGKHRFMPGNLFFYGNFCIIQDTDQKTKTRFKRKPLIQDLEWELAYMMLEARGFSGWEDDDEYTSNKLWFEYNKNGIPNTEVNLNLINKQGKLKKYLPPRENLKKLHDTPKGLPLIENEARNFFILGSRGGGKSYFIALAGLLYFICFDGRSRYIQGDPRKLKAEMCLGSGNTNKSGEMMLKIEDCMNEFGHNPELGVFGSEGDNNWTPMPFYRDMTGKTTSGNKDSGGWRHEYSKKINGRWQEGFGTGTLLYHVSYSDKKKDGAQAASGGRYLFTVWEEVGESSIVQDGWASNNATVKTSGLQFGMQGFLGTSGNMELILPSKEMFTDPSQYNILEYEDIYEGTGKIGFFLPAYLTYRQFKDKQGNTDLRAAKSHWLKGFEEASKAKNPKKLRMYCMNYPAIPSHMWVTDKKYLLPFLEAQKRERDLMKNNLYKEVGTNIELFWDSNKGVDYNIKQSASPFYDFPIRKDRDTLDGGVRIFDFPQRINGEIPSDLYWFLHDPYVSDDQDEGESLGVTYVVTNPKYQHTGIDSPKIVATYISKPLGGKREYYKTLEKLLAFYGNPIRGLWYEANRGEFCRSFFVHNKKTELLALRPQLSKGDDAIEKKIAKYGFIVGNKVSKLSMVDDLDNLLTEAALCANKMIPFIESIQCIWTIRQIMQFDMDGNFDGISALLAYPMAIRETTMEQERKMVSRKRNRLAFLSQNKKAFS